jgi:hypothetical protein
MSVSMEVVQQNAVTRPKYKVFSTRAEQKLLNRETQNLTKKLLLSTDNPDPATCSL